jgi:hypothetical protein
VQRFAPLLVVLAGCPYIFGPADLSRVPKPAGTTGETGTPALPTGDTGPVGPVVTRVRALPLYEAVDLLFDFEPAGALAEGGTLVVEVDDDAPIELPIGDEAVLLGDAAVRWRLAVPGSCDGIQRTIRATVLDPLGRSGGSGSLELDIAGAGIVPEQAGLYELGELTPPVVFCGDIGTQQDSDPMRIVAGAGGEMLAVLSFTAGGNPDLDFVLFENGSYAVAGYGVYVNPEIVPVIVTQGVPYEINVTYWSGQVPVPYQFALLPQDDGTTPPTPTGTGDTGP